MAGLPQTSQVSQNQPMVNYSIGELEKVGEYIVKSGLFGITKKEQAVALLLLAQSEGMHPMQAVKKYHIVQGKPVKKAETMLAEFLKSGGKVKWHELTNEVADATFIAPNGDSIRIKWTIKDVEKIANVTYDKNGNKIVKRLIDKDNWKNYPRAMLRSRVISEGIRTIWPEITEGIYTPEEVIDMDVVNFEEPVEENNKNHTSETVETEQPEEQPQKEWKISEIKTIIKPELKNIFAEKKARVDEIEKLFNEFNGDQNAILEYLKSQQGQNQSQKK